MATQPNLIKMPWAKNGAKVTIPETTTTLGVASLSQGFPTETELPIDNGGIPPRRVDFNGAFNMLSMFAMFQQSGGQFSWSAQVDYDPPCIIYHNSDLWWCLRSNGVSTTAVEPGTNATYWIKFKSYISSPLDAYPIGSYYISSNSTSPATLFGGTWTQVKDRMILAAGDTYTAGNTGGAATVKLAVGNLPSHTHSCGSAGAHTHTRGSMEITGSIKSNDTTEPLTFSDSITSSGALSVGGYHTWANGGVTDTVQGASYEQINFKASSNWSGSTSTAGNHNHTIGNTGNGTALNVMNPYIVAYVWRRTA